MDSLLWKGEVGRVIRDSLMISFPGLPQHEPYFRLVHIDPADFRNILQLHRNILMVETGPLTGDKNYSLTFKNNIYSNPQLILNLRAVNQEYLESALLQMTPTIIDKLYKEERVRAVLSLKKMPSLKVSRDLQQHTGISIPLTDDYFVALQKPNYAWVRKETVHMSTSMQIYKFTYTSDTIFSAQSIVSIRDSLSKLYIPGPSEGSYMTTDSLYPLTIESATIDNKYGVAVRGLWRTKGDFMGGPFISFLILDEQKNELLFIDGFVYAPRFNKREYMKHLEATVYSLEFSN